MPALGKQRHFEILREVLALAEERKSIPLAEAAAAVGIDEARLRELLKPVLFLEFRTGTGELLPAWSDFLVTEDDRLVIEHDHWLRDLAADPPSADTALRLLVAGLAMQSLATEPTPDLDRAVAKLRGVVDAQLQLSVPKPPCLAVAQQSWRDGQSLCFRYVRDNDAASSDREAVPYRVYCKWGHWYFQGRELDETEPKQFRIDRMLDARLGDVEFDPPPDTEIPAWFDLSEHERIVTLRLTTAQLDALPRPHAVRSETALADGRIETRVAVSGDRRLDSLLVCLHPAVEIVDPPDCGARQRAHAAQLLADYVA